MSELSAATARRLEVDQSPLDAFGVDLRSLAALRIGYALLILIDLYNRSRDLRAHYTDYGVLPREAFSLLFREEGWVSFHLANGSAEFQAALFAVHALLASALLVGYRTRWTGPLCWLFLISLQTRNPMVLNGGDVYIRCIFFWALFTPWDRIWSIDSVLNPQYWRVPLQVRSMASFAYLVQVAVVYWFAVIPKNDPKWMVDGTATYYALSLDQFAKPLAHRLLEYPELLQNLTYFVWYFEFIAPFFLLLPFQLPRTLAVFGLAGMHFGFLSCLHLGLFGWIGMVSVVGALPAMFWERLFRGRAVVRVQQFFWHLARWLFPERVAELPQNPYVPMVAGPMLGWPVQLALALFLVHIFNWNLNNEMLKPRFITIPRNLRYLTHMLRMDQRWNMFSPGPAIEDGWYVMAGKLRQGNEADLWLQKPHTVYAKPDDVSATYYNQRWRKYLMNLWDRGHEKHRLYFGRYLCRSWNAGHKFQEEVVEFKMHYMLEVTPPPGEKTEVEQVTIWEHYCFAMPDENKVEEPKPTPEATPQPSPSPVPQWSGPVEKKDPTIPNK